MVDPRDALFERADSTAGLRERTMTGLRWTLGMQAVGFVVQLVSLAVLARLLTPDDYGLFAMVIAIALFGEQFLGLGLAQAVVQRERITHLQVSNLFWVNVAIGLVIAGILAACAPLIAAFYGRAELVSMTWVLAGGFVFSALTVQHNSILMRHLRFRAIALRTLTARAVGVALAIALGVLGAGYWALVANQVMTAAAGCVFLWLASPWRPSLPRRGQEMRPLLSYGGGLSTFGILNYVSRNADNVIVGWWLGATQLGLYSRAYSLLMLPVQQLGRPLSGVAQPTLSALWCEPERYRRYFVSAVTGLAFIGLPLVAFLAALAPEVVAVALGEQWTGVVDVFRILSVVGAMQIISLANGWLYVTSGQAWRMARWALVSRPLLVGSFFLGLRWGIEGVAAAYAVAQLMLLPFGFWYAVRGTPVRLSDIGAAAWRPLLLSAGFGALCLGSALVTDDWPELASLVLASVVGGSALVGTIWLWRPARRDVLGLLRRSPGGGEGDAPHAAAA